MNAYLALLTALAATGTVAPATVHPTTGPAPADHGPVTVSAQAVAQLLADRPLECWDGWWENVGDNGQWGNCWGENGWPNGWYQTAHDSGSAPHAADGAQPLRQVLSSV